MCAMQSLAGEQTDRVIEESIRRRAHAVLNLRGSRGWRTLKAKFVSGSRSSGRLTLLARLRGDEPKEALPSPGDTVGITFRVGHKKCMYGTALANLDQRPEGTLLTVGWPDQLEQLQRRAFERVAPPQGCVIAVRFWHDGAGEESSRTVRYGQLEDLSAGGMRITVSDRSALELDTMYKCVFAPRSGAASVVVEATLRHEEPAENGRTSLGFQFIGLETTPDGCRLLDQLAGIVQQFLRANRSAQRHSNTASTQRL